MPTYQYKCDFCSFEFEIKQGYHDKPKKKCPQCKAHKLYRVYSVYAAIIGEPKTLGHQADRNTQKMGKYELENARSTLPPIEDPKRKAKRQKLNKLGKLNTEQKEKYIETGKMP
jgi:putative FmdB family regulatory protein